MRKFSLAIGGMLYLIATLVAINPQPALAQSTHTLYITNIWARPTRLDAPDNMDNMDMDATHQADMGTMDGMAMDIPPSAVYMTITNPTDEVVRLVSVDTPYATTQIHETTIENDVMQMRELEGGLIILEGERVQLEQGGLHIMLMSLTRELVPGDALPLTLNFVVNASGESFSIITAAPVLEEAPTPNNTIIITDAWARATLIGEMPTTDEHAGMDMGGMAMEATEEAPMDGMAMSIPPSAIYMNILNLGDNDITLTGVHTTVTDTAQIHETSLENDVMRMRELEDGLSIPAGGNVTLEQGGYHIMMMGLTRELTVDDTISDAITVTLVFSDGTEITIGVPVLESAAMLPTNQ